MLVRFDDGSGERIVAPADLRLREFGFPSSAYYDSRQAGTIRVTVSLRHEGRLSEGKSSCRFSPTGATASPSI